MIRENIYIILVMLCFFGAALISCTEGQQEVGDQEVSTQLVQSETVAIADILADKDAFRDKEVAVFGKVAAGLAFEFVSEQPYLLEDGDAQLWVITSGIVPQEGTVATVQGKVVTPYQIKGRRYDVVLLESEIR